MPIWLAFIVLIIGFVALVKGADFFVDGASSIAKYLKVSSLVIGLTVVAFGTSLPEAAVSISSAIQNIDDVSIGNVIGSNIFNLFLILGLSALVFPVFVKTELTKRDIPVSILGPVLLILMMFFLDHNGNPALTRWEGLIIVLTFSVYMFFTFRSQLKNKDDSGYEEVEDKPLLSKPKAIILTLLGLVGIVAGGIMVTSGAKEIAIFFGMSEWLVGLTIVSVGTSLPELVTSVVAAVKKESDIAVGNVVGSNIFNIFFVLGFSSLVTPIALNKTALFDLTFLIVGSLILLAIVIIRKGKLGRIEGLLLTCMYIGYIIYIILRDMPK